MWEPPNRIWSLLWSRQSAVWPFVTTTGQGVGASKPSSSGTSSTLTPDRDPLKQAAASADRIHEILQCMTGEEVDVRPVVIFPGWYVQVKCRRPRIWVVNEEYLRAWLDRDDEQLTSEQVRRYTAALEGYIRTRAKQKRS